MTALVNVKLYLYAKKDTSGTKLLALVKQLLLLVPSDATQLKASP